MFRGGHFNRSVILLCVRWYLAYGLSLRNLEEMMAERGVAVDHTTIHRWTIRYAPLLLKRFNRRKRAVSRRWHVNETYIGVRRRWMYLYRTVDSNGDTAEFWFSERRVLTAAKRFLRKALKRHGRPEDCDRWRSDEPRGNPVLRHGKPTPRSLTKSAEAHSYPTKSYLNNRIEQDYRAIKRRVRPMLGFQSFILPVRYSAGLR